MKAIRYALAIGFAAAVVLVTPAVAGASNGGDTGRGTPPTTPKPTVPPTVPPVPPTVPPTPPTVPPAPAPEPEPLVTPEAIVEPTTTALAVAAETTTTLEQAGSAGPCPTAKPDDDLTFPWWALAVVGVGGYLAGAVRRRKANSDNPEEVEAGPPVEADSNAPSPA